MCGLVSTAIFFAKGSQSPAGPCDTTSAMSFAVFAVLVPLAFISVLDDVTLEPYAQ